MSYVALYRSYRPKNFDEVVGQKVIVKTLQTALKNDKLGHAYLFNGPRGTGKTTIAKIVAKTLNCREAPTANPCEQCDICLGISKGDVADIIEIDAASNNGVGEIRELRDKIKYAPSVAKNKVYIIDEVHMLTTEAFNALLKTLEEPPKNVVFILATTEIHKVPATIISRTQRFDFKNIEDEELIRKLTEVVSKEGIQIEAEAIKAIAIQAEGGMRDALSLLDQITSFSTEIVEEDVYTLTGGLSSQTIENLLLAISNKDAKETLTLFSNTLSQGKDISKIISDLILALRDCLLDQTKTKKKYSKLVGLTSVMIYTYLAILNDVSQDIKWTNQKRAYFEMALLRMINDASVINTEYQIEIDKLKQDVLKLKELINNQSTLPPKLDKTNNNPNLTPLVTIADIQTVLHDAKKGYQQEMLGNLEVDANLKMAAYYLNKGELITGSEEALIFAYDDLVTTKIVYRLDVKEKILEIIKMVYPNIKDYFAVLKSDWILIKHDYVEQYKNKITKPTLKPIDLHLYEDELIEVKKNKTIELAKEFFGEEIVKVEE